MADRKHETGICPICQEEAGARHFSKVHNIRVKDHFSRQSGNVRSCKHCKHKSSGIFEAMEHLKNDHPEFLPQQSESGSVAEQDADSPDEVDLDWVLAHATLVGLLDFVSDKRREAEAETECIRVPMNTLKRELNESRERINKLKRVNEELRRGNGEFKHANEELRQENTELSEKNRKLSEESTRILEDNRKMNQELLSFRNGAISTADLRDTYRESIGNR